MTDAQTLSLAGDFPAATQDQWMALVEKTLKGKPADKALIDHLAGGVAISALNTREDWDASGDPSGLPGHAPFTRGGAAAGVSAVGWDIRQTAVHPDPAVANTQILHDLERGAVSVSLRLDLAARTGLDGDADGPLAGEDGLMVYSLEALEAALNGVHADGAVVGLEAGGAFEAAAATLHALWKKRGVAPSAALGAFNADPIGTLAGLGALPMSMDRALERLGALAVHTAATYPKCTAVMVDTGAHHGAGASEAQDLACALATGVAYLRAMERSGLDLGSAARQIVFSLPLDADQFPAIAKLRAARLLWGQVCAACGITGPDAAMRLHAYPSSRILTRRDPWVNMLRTTVTCFAAAVGGADAITTAPFDSALGVPTDFARRIARNIQVVLMEESHLGKVIDPAGGSWFVEKLTEDLAASAWSEFQAIENQGGIVAALDSGWLQARIGATREARRGDLSKRKFPVTGVSEFPNIAEKPVEGMAVSLDALRTAASAALAATRPATVGPIADTGQAMEAALAGTSIAQITAAFSDGTVTSIEPQADFSYAEDYEALRDQAEAIAAETGAVPKIFLANLGPVAVHTARATFAKNLFEAGGIEAVPGAGADAAEELVAAYKDSGAAFAVLCSSDEMYAEMGVAATAALKAAGAQRILCAGRLGEAATALEEAGVTGFVYVGCDVLSVLTELLSFYSADDTADQTDQTEA